MKLKLKPINLPLIKIDKQKYQNFYSICINAIKDNKDGVINKKECIESIRKLREESLRQEQKKTCLNSSLLNTNISFPKLKLKRKILKKVIINKKRTLSQILSDSKKSDKRLMEKRQISAKLLDFDNPNQNQVINLEGFNLNRLKSNTMNYQQLKKIKMVTLKNNKGIRNKNKMKNKKNIKKNIKKKEHISQKLPHRYYVFKKIMEYLESNNIPIFEFLQHNPFQTKPYQMSKGYEFLEAVKFNNYEYVINALESSTDYLFVFDYFGQTCYHWAAKLGNIEMLQLLLEFGRHHNQKDFKGRTPLYLAAVNDNKEVCEFLLKNNANLHLEDKFGNSPADVAGSRDLQYELMDCLARPFSNPFYKKKIIDFLRERRKKVLETLKEKYNLNEEKPGNRENENNK